MIPLPEMDDANPLNWPKSKHERARYIGIWTSMVTIGVPLAPVIFGFVALRVGYRWIYWILAITNGVQFVLYFFFGSETRYIGKEIQLEKATSWDITPLIGAGIAATGNQVVTTVSITYSVDCYPQDAAAIGVFVTFVRQIWGFIGPFWFPEMIAELGLGKSTAVSNALIVVASVFPTILVQWMGKTWRKA
ncbi:unnamed protein product [Clonostachys chloroleuca]|uniref:Major facilitator superfamily (MFS) profile domain-containing protein n=1 Tax=Clonostachys chloroleuca TaxID=1926264 RepID=A0AA35Q6N4_9HYPO|nr:unnamed protein product [Clonostachys chloroleuca]